MKKISITTSWDDGHILDIKLAQLLKKYNLKGTFYISPKDREFSSENLLNEEQIKSLSEDFEIGAHTMTHPHLTNIDDETARGEIEGSKKYLENVTQKNVTSFCYPSGDYTQKHENIVKEAGFSLARTVKRFRINTGNDYFALPTTVHAYRHWSDALPILKAVGVRNFIKAYLNWDELAIILFEKVLKNGGTFHLWGHSWEIEKNNDWERLETVLKFISNRNEAHYMNNEGLVLNNNKNKKVLFVAPYFKPHSGGLENYVANIEGGLKNLSWDTVVVTSGEPGDDYKEELIDGTKVYRLPTWLKVSNTPINPLWYFYLRKIIKKENPDIINAHLPVPGISDMAALASGKIPFVMTYHAGSMLKNRMPEDLIISFYEKLILPLTAKKAVKIVCPSQFVIDSLLHQFKDKSTVINPGVNIDIFKPAEIDHTEKNTILFIARFKNMHKMKGFYILAQAMRNLPDVTLKVIGEKSESKCKNIIFLGTKSAQEIAREMQNSTVVVLPSLAHAESFGMVLIEAMACKKPVIGTRIGGIPEVIRDNVDGLLVTADNASELTEALKKIVYDPEFAHSLAEKGFEKVTTKYTWTEKIAETNNLFKKILEQD